MDWNKYNIQIIKRALNDLDKAYPYKFTDKEDERNLFDSYIKLNNIVKKHEREINNSNST